MPVQISKNVYTLASVDDNRAELTMYGDIYEARPVDWWTGEPIEGDFILLDEFLTDLDEILGMMAETTYMTGAEAKEKGFADKLIEDAEPLAIAASADGHTIYINKRSFHLAPGMSAPEALEKIEPPEIWRERQLAKLRKE